MLLGIDHLVIAVRDPVAAATDLEATLGLAFTGGGRHDGRGTYNRLAFLGDTFLELIGVEDRALLVAAVGFPVSHASLALLDAGHEGLATFALATDDAAAEVARLRALGSVIGDAVAGSRMRPDGELVRWTTAFPALGPGEPPFLIEHEPAGSEWGPEVRAARAGFGHPVGGAVRLRTLTLPVADPVLTAEGYRATLGIPFDAEGTDRRSTVADQVIVLSPAGGPQTVDLEVEPGTPPLDEVRFGIRWRRVTRGDVG